MPQAWRWVRLTWWPIFLAFLLVIAAFTRDRACFDRYHLLPGLDRHPAFAWLVAMTYVLGHCWLAAVYVCAVVESGDVAPRWRTVRASGGVAWWQVVPMLALVVLEYAPSALWKQVAVSAGLCGP